MLKSLLHRLYQQGYLQSVSDRGTIHEFSYKYEGRLVNQQVTVKPMLEYSALKRICRGAISGNLTDMVTVAMMYNVGFGLPANKEVALLWTGFSTLDVAANADFSAACRKLRKDYTKAPAIIYPDQLTLPCLFAAERLERFEIKTPEHIYAVPQFDGMRVYLFYRKVPGVAPHLYAAFSGDRFVSIDKLIALGIPRYLGEHNNRQIIVEEYLPDNLVVAVATIAVVNGGTKDPVHYFDAYDCSALLPESDFAERPDTVNINNMKDEMQRLSKVLQRREDAEIRRKVSRLKRQIHIAESQTYDPEEAYAKYLCTKPQHYLKVVVTEIYNYRSKEGFVAVGNGYMAQQLLQTYGFNCLCHPALEQAFFVTTKTVKQLKALFEKVTGLRVIGFLMQTSASTPVRRFPMES